MGKEVYREASQYIERGWSVIPIIRGEKRPPIKWDEYRQRLATDTELQSWFLNTDNGIGIVTGELSGVTVIDYDRHKITNTDLAKEYNAVFRQFPTLTSTTKNKGNHFLYADFDQSHTFPVIPAIDFQAEGSIIVAPPSDGYKWSRVRDLAGFDEDIVSSLSEGYATALSLNCKAEILKTKGKLGNGKGNGMGYFEPGRRNEDITSIAVSLKNGGCPVDKALALISSLEIYSDGDFSVKDAQKTVMSIYNMDSPLKRKLSHDVREWVGVACGEFTVSDVYRDVALITKEERGAARKTLQRMVEEGQLQTKGARSGVYRKINSDCPRIDWRGASATDEIPIKYPFGIHKHYMTFPKTLMLIDGDKGAGKSAFMLNVAYMNVGEFKDQIHYFSSEMGPQEIKSRCTLFPEPDRFESVDFRERSRDFDDVIVPDEINIIDFLELGPDDYVRVNEIIRRCWDKLTTGTIIMARQKARGSRRGRGGDLGVEKARIVLLLEEDKVTVDSAKNLRNPKVPLAGKETHFDLEEGWKFTQTN